MHFVFFVKYRSLFFIPKNPSFATLLIFSPPPPLLPPPSHGMPTKIVPGHHTQHYMTPPPRLIPLIFGPYTQKSYEGPAVGHTQFPNASPPLGFLTPPPPPCNLQKIDFFLGKSSMFSLKKTCFF